MKKKFYIRNKAFTLAEVLITLGIIGVVAAMTIPIVMGNSAKKEAASKLLKAYSVVSSISATLRNENGGDLSGAATDSPTLANLFKPYMSVIKSCQDASDTANCYIASTGDVYNLQGTTLGGLSPYYFNGEAKVVTGDGIMYNFELLSSPCSGGNYTRNGVAENCGGVMVDINGAKLPNTAGKDLFFISVNKFNTTVNVGAGCDKASVNTWNGTGCAEKIVREGGINYY